MWIGSEFPGDDNKLLMKIQHDLWFGINNTYIAISNLGVSNCYYIFYVARQALSFLDPSNPLLRAYGDQIFAINSFDHRVLQGFHQIIASYYRWLMRGVKPPPFEKNERIYYNYLLSAWKSYLISELDDMTSSYRNWQLIENIVKAVFFANTDKGYKAEDFIVNALVERYDKLFWEERENYRKSKK